MFEVKVHYNVRLIMRDGIELSANLWFPIAPHTDRVFPAILEMIPYRKDDWRYVTDHQHGTYFAQRGYVFCRVDVRGTGSSQGLALDEYTPQETQDGYDVVEWLAAQSWCNGNVGMWGISYGGFTSIQVAMLQPPHLKAIVPMYATDDRYTDDVHYIGGCVTASELAQYAVSQIAMNAMPPKSDYARDTWAAEWKERLAHTPPWLIEWLRHQTDGPYWRQGSLAPDYARITCAVFNIGGWNDEYTNSVLRMQAHCINASCKGLIGNWVHSYPEDAYPGPNLDWLHEATRFFDHWLKGIDTGIMAEPPLTIFLREYTLPEAFPQSMNGHWHSERAYPIERLTSTAFFLGDSSLALGRGGGSEGCDTLEHRPTLGTQAALCFGGGVSPNGLARDLRPDEALSLTYTTAPLDESLDILGLPAAILYVSSIAPVAHLVVRLTDVAPDGTSSHVTSGILNLTHRDGHTQPRALENGQIYEVRVELKAAGYRFLKGHRIRLSVASAYWPVIFPSPYPNTLTLHRGGDYPSRLILPVVSVDPNPPAVPDFKTTPPDRIVIGSSREEDGVWQITEDVIRDTVTVKLYGGDTTTLPDGTTLYEAETIEMTAHHHDPARALLHNDVHYRLTEHDYVTDIHASGNIRATATDFHVDVQLLIKLNGSEFFQKSWLESIPRLLV